MTDSNQLRINLGITIKIYKLQMNIEGYEVLNRRQKRIYQLIFMSRAMFLKRLVAPEQVRKARHSRGTKIMPPSDQPRFFGSGVRQRAAEWRSRLCGLRRAGTVTITRSESLGSAQWRAAMRQGQPPFRRRSDHRMDEVGLRRWCG